MKILILANNDMGLYKFRKELIQKFIDKGDQVYISLPDGPMVRKLECVGCKFFDTAIDRRGINPMTDFKLFLSYMRMIMKLKPDLVVTYTIKPNIYGGMAARFLGVMYAVNITGVGTAFQKHGLIKCIVSNLYKVALKKAKVVFFENVENKEEFVNRYIIKEKQSCLLNGAGVNLEDYPYCTYPSEESGIRFLFIGRVMKEKGIQEFLEMATIIKRKYAYTFFDIVGPLEENYKDIVDDFSKKKIIEYYGFQEDVRPYINKCHCFVLPSYHEGMANTLLEAGASGRPLITSRINGCLEAVDEGVNGFLVSVKNTEELIIAVERFLNLSLEERKEMGKKSRAFISNKFDKKTVVEQTMKHLCC